MITKFGTSWRNKLVRLNLIELWYTGNKPVCYIERRYSSLCTYTSMNISSFQLSKNRLKRYQRITTK